MWLRFVLVISCECPPYTGCPALRTRTVVLNVRILAYNTGVHSHTVATTRRLSPNRSGRLEPLTHPFPLQYYPTQGDISCVQRALAWPVLWDMRKNTLRKYALPVLWSQAKRAVLRTKPTEYHPPHRSTPQQSMIANMHSLVYAPFPLLLELFAVEVLLYRVHSQRKVSVRQRAVDFPPKRDGQEVVLLQQIHYVARSLRISTSSSSNIDLCHRRSLECLPVVELPTRRG